MQKELQPQTEDASGRKADHIDLAFKSQVDLLHADKRFYYEPMLSGHPDPDTDIPVTFCGKDQRYPIWVSSMTGGTDKALHINTNLARMCAEFGFGMGLGSCRSLLFSNDRLSDFDMRPIIGRDLSLFANLGIAQIEECLEDHAADAIQGMIAKVDADGLIVHVNPLQEWAQPEGDHIKRPPTETIQALAELVDTKLIVKEVGQGFGPRSIAKLLRLPIDAIEMAAHGGTNFTKLELLRASGDVRDAYTDMALVGHSAEEMVDFINGAVEDLQGNVHGKEVIISGGLKGFLDGYYLINKLQLPSIYGHASLFLKYAKEDYATLQKFAQMQIDGLKMASTCLTVR